MKGKYLMSFTHPGFADLLNQYAYTISIGDITAGTIFSQEKAGYLVDIGVMRAAYLPQQEVSIYHQHNPIAVNDTTEFFIFAYNIKLQQYILSLKRLTYLHISERVRQIKDEDLILHAKVIAFNQGGLVVTFEQIQGFIPNSHLAYSVNKREILSELIPCKILEVNNDLSELILSNRCALLEQVLCKLEVGKYIHGIVREIKHYGVMLDIYNLPALLHISDIPFVKPQNIDSIFQLGMQIQVKIIHIDLKQGRISVSY